MKYIDNQDFDHGREARIGVLITNLGTPLAPRTAELRIYLKQFLSDPRIVEVPRLLWWFILNGVILNLRPRRSAAAYRKIWTSDGSPLLVHTRAQAEALQTFLSRQFGNKLIVDFAMRYGEPSIKAGVQGLLDRGVTKLLVLPLYPQYCAATTAGSLARRVSWNRKTPRSGVSNCWAPSLILPMTGRCTMAWAWERRAPTRSCQGWWVLPPMSSMRGNFLCGGAMIYKLWRVRHERNAGQHRYGYNAGAATGVGTFLPL